MGKVAYTVPHGGQMGYHHRTEHNKRILEMGTKESTSKINLKGGFWNYGNIKNDYLVLDGSVPGPSKRLIRVRRATRTNQKAANVKEQKIIAITTTK
jgi:large subunit ribosomal protein L3